MQKLSTGADATLGNYLWLAELFGMSGGVALLKKRIAESPNGADEEVLADEGQMLILLAHAAD